MATTTDAVGVYLDVKKRWAANKGSSNGVPNTSASDVQRIIDLMVPLFDMGGDLEGAYAHREDNEAIRALVERPKAFGTSWQATTYYRTARQRFIDAGPNFAEKATGIWSSYKNSRFWSAFSDFAKERSAAGTVPPWTTFAKEAIVESAQEFAQRAKDALDVFPSVDPLVNLVKWGTLAGGMYLLYTVLKPEKSK